MTDKKMEDNIRNYSKKIKTLDNYVKAIRQNIGVYIGSNDRRALLTLIREIYQNAIDEMIKMDSPCNEVWIEFDERNLVTTVRDNGRGLPFDDIERILTSMNTSSNYDKELGNFSSGKHGLGAKAMCALSSYCIVESYIFGEAKRMEFEDGLVTKKLHSIKSPHKQGTQITFCPAKEVFVEFDLKVIEVLDLVKIILQLTPIGSKVNFKSTDLNGNVYTESIINEDGIIADLINKTVNPLVKPIIIEENNGKMKAEIAFTYDSNDLNIEQISSFANFCPHVKGEHVNGFLEGICRFFREYMNKIYLNGTKSKMTITNNDVKIGLKGIIAVSHLNPIFAGQAKEVLTNKDMFYFIKDLVYNGLDQWSKENSNELQKLCKYFKDIAEIRVKSEEGKIKLRDRYVSSVLSGLPAKYVKPTGKEHLELIITEGDSAAGHIKNNRCNKRQGIFPIRGKLPNAFNTKKENFLGNTEIASIITLIGGGYGRSFDIDNVKWEKVIIACDSDLDGAHIRALILRFIISYMPQLISEGRLFSAVPPLYGMNIGRGKNKKTLYFNDKLDYIKYNQKEFSKNNKLTDLNGKNISENEITKLLYDNNYYTYEMGIISDRYAINPYLLEYILMNRKESLKNLNTILRKRFRFLNDLTKKKDTIIIEGLVNSKFQTVFLNDKLIKDSYNILEYIDGNLNRFYLLNGEIISLYGLLIKFENTVSSDITRYKGLGEMNPEELEESTTHPDMQRTLIKYTIEDIKKELETMQYLDSDKKEIIKDMKISRFDVLG